MTSKPPSADELRSLGLPDDQAAAMASRLASIWDQPDAALRWQQIAAQVLSPRVPFAVHHALFERNYADWELAAAPPPAWLPAPADIGRANLTRLLQRKGLPNLEELTAWAARDCDGYWSLMIDVLGIHFAIPPQRTAELTLGVEAPRWLPGARLNIAASCWQQRPDTTAIIADDERGRRRQMTYGELSDAAGRFAGALRARGVRPGDAVALIMPLTIEAVVAFLGTILAGAIAVGIADSFAGGEIERRIRIGAAKLVVIQDVLLRGGKTLPLYDKLSAISAPTAIVVSTASDADPRLRSGDVFWSDFLAATQSIEPVLCNPSDTTTVLFSSGTTGEPKAIPWTHTTPIKCAADGHLYQDIQPGDVACWPTSMGWMMGPWLIYAGLINRATIALFDGHPATPGFCRFVERAGVTMLGVVPSLVAAWHSSGAWNDADWSAVRVFSSTGECSQPEQMLSLMSRAGYRPVIEYCGGTEIGGGYITSTVLRPSAPSCFNQVALGLRLAIRDADGRPAQRGEAFLAGASIGLSTQLLNADHHAVYHAGTPTDDFPSPLGGEGQGERFLRRRAGTPLRRHGDSLEELPGGYYCVLGRADDAMNLGGIKISAVEIEQVLNRHPDVAETAAVSLADPSGGPSHLVVFAVPATPPTRSDALGDQPTNALREQLQALVRDQLNPLFRIAEVRWIAALPRTASNKMMRRLLRDSLRT